MRKGREICQEVVMAIFGNKLLFAIEQKLLVKGIPLVTVNVIRDLFCHFPAMESFAGIES